MTVRDFINRGTFIRDRNVASGSIPEAAPTLVSHGQALPLQSAAGAVTILPPLLLVATDLEAGTSPTATLQFYGYVEPPATSPSLLSDWQLIKEITIQDAVGKTLAIFPLTGFARYHVVVTGSTGSPTSVRLREYGVSHHAAATLIGLGLVAGASSQMSLIARDTLPSASTEGDQVDAIADLYGRQRTVDAAWESLSQANHVLVDNPSEDKHDGNPLVEVVNGTDGTYYYYIDMLGYTRLGLDLILNGGSGTVTVTVEATRQDDGTVKESCTYYDVTNAAYGAASYTASSSLSDSAQFFADKRWVRVKVVASTGGANDGDWTVFPAKEGA